MKYQDLDNNSYSVPLGAYVLIDSKRPRSQLHLNARKLIKEIYPTITITEEVPVKVQRRKTLYLDFFIPMFSMVIEVHGEQHYSYSSHFHGSTADFLLQKQNDSIKKEWCDYNRFRLVELPYNEDIVQWRMRILTKD